MENKPLASIIIPCYNGEKTIGRMLDSIIAQTYRPIELIVVNDGSTDNSDAIILSYQNDFENSGIIFKYLSQENIGLGGAINRGLKEFTGDYLCWADSDDYFHKYSIKHRLEFLESHPEYSIVTSDAYIVKDNDLDNTQNKFSFGVTNNQDENQFWHLLNSNSIFCPGCHMVRTKEFLDVNPTRSIYQAPRGQNWQMLLPIYYKYKRYFLDEPLYYYVIYPNSMSKDINLEQTLYRCDEHEKIIFETLKTIEMSKEDFEKAKEQVMILYSRKRMHLYAENNICKKAREQYKILKYLNNCNFKDWLVGCTGMYSIYLKIVKKFR